MLPYEAVREGGDEALVAFLDTTYAAAADRVSAWDGLVADPPVPAPRRRLRPR